jgi:ribose transport system ATP-binding protein
VLFVSHDLVEIGALCDRVTVLRDGRNAGTRLLPATAPQDLFELVTGHPPVRGAIRPPAPKARRRGLPIALEGLAGADVSELSLLLVPGEIVGLAGPPRSGYEQVPYLLFGARAARAGRLTLGHTGYELADMTPHRALRAGLGLLPGDRGRQGTVASLSLEDNLTLALLSDGTRSWRLSRRALRAEARELLGEFAISPAQPRASAGQLSGGNMQRLLLARWLALRPQLLLAHEPTRGVDQGTRGSLIGRLRAHAEAGGAILCASSDPEELASLCDRVLVFSAGAPAHELREGQLTRERITTLCGTGG